VARLTEVATEKRLMVDRIKDYRLETERVHQDELDREAEVAVVRLMEVATENSLVADRIHNENSVYDYAATEKDRLAY